DLLPADKSCARRSTGPRTSSGAPAPLPVRPAARIAPGCPSASPPGRRTSSPARPQPPLRRSKGERRKRKRRFLQWLVSRLPPCSDEHCRMPPLLSGEPMTLYSTTAELRAALAAYARPQVSGDGLAIAMPDRFREEIVDGLVWTAVFGPEETRDAARRAIRESAE